jgi:GxxExxY protein
LGNGFLEAVYQEALEKEFQIRNIPYRRESQLPIYYKNEPLDKFYAADFICYDKIMLELKALSVINNEHQVQVLNYLKAAKLNLGLILNFGKQRLEHKRIIKEKL